MGFIQRYSYQPSLTQLLQLESVVIVDQPPPGTITGVGTGTSCNIGEWPDCTKSTAISPSGVVSTLFQATEVFSAADYLTQYGGFDPSIGDFGNSGGNGFLDLKNKSFSRLLLVGINLASDRACRFWRQLPTNQSATSPSPAVPMQGVSVAAGKQFSDPSNHRVNTAGPLSFTSDPAFAVGTDLVSVAPFATSAGESVPTMQVQSLGTTGFGSVANIGDAVVVDVINTASTAVLTVPTAPMLIGATTLTVASTSGFPSSGFLTVDSAPSAEVVQYTGVNGNTFTGVTRGANGTIPINAAIQTTSVTGGPVLATGPVTATLTTAFPASGYIVLDAEIIAYSTNVGNVFGGVTRGALNTFATAHAALTPIYYVANSTTTALGLVAPATTLSAPGITGTPPTFTVASAAGYPAAGYVTIGTEIIQYSSVNTGTGVVTVAVNGRGAFGTTVADHLTTAPVTLFSVNSATQQLLTVTSSVGIAIGAYLLLTGTNPSVSEIVLVNAIPSGTSLNVLRAQLGSTAAVGISAGSSVVSPISHINGAQVVSANNAGTYRLNQYPLPPTAATGASILLTANAGATDTTLTVNGISTAPASGFLLIDSEIMSYSGTTATSFTGVTRGVKGSTRAPHTTGTLVNVLAITTLATAVTASFTTSLTVPSAFGFPQNVTPGSAPLGFLLIGNEVVAYAATNAGNTQFLSLTRGVNGTTASNYPAGTQVLLFLASSVSNGPGVVPTDDLIQVSSIVGFPSKGLLLLGGSNGELVSYTGASSNTFTGVTRGLNGTVPGTWAQNTVVSSPQTMTIERQDGSNFTNFNWIGTGVYNNVASLKSQLPWRIHPALSADTGGHNILAQYIGTVQNPGGYSIPARPLDAAVAPGTLLSTSSITPTAVVWDPLSGFTGITIPTAGASTQAGAPGLAYDPTVQAPNAAASTNFDVAYSAAFDSLLSNGSPIGDINLVWPARTSSNIRAKQSQHVNDASFRNLGRMTVMSPAMQAVTSTSQAIGADPGVATIRNERAVYAWPGVQTFVPEAVGFNIQTASPSVMTTTGNLDTPFNSWVISVLSNLAPELDAGQAAAPATTVLAPITALQRGLQNPLNITDYIAFKANGISAPIIDRDFGPMIQSSVTTSLQVNQTAINRRRFADFVNDSVARRLQAFVKLPMTTSLKQTIQSEMVAFYNQLLSPSNPSTQRIVAFSVDIKSGNTPALEAAGIFVVQSKVQMTPIALVIELVSQVGPTVVISTAT